MFVQPYLRRLAARGHEVTVYTLYPRTNDTIIPNYSEIDLNVCPSLPRSAFELDDTFSRYSGLAVAKLMFVQPIKDIATVQSFEQCPPLMELLGSTKEYDLLITETFRSEAMLMFANKFDVPFVASMPNVLFPFHATRVGNAANPSYVTTLDITTALGYSSSMTFLQRVVNTVAYVVTVFMYYAFTMRQETEVVRHFLGPSAPSLHDTVKTTSLVLTNADSVLTPAYPQAPNVLQVAGMQIEEAKVLPEVGPLLVDQIIVSV